MRILVTGGVRSGKSTHAEALVGDEPATYVAPGPTPDAEADPDWAARIEAHLARRPRSWSTLESRDVAAAVRYLKKNAGQYGLDAQRFAMLGDSAGGHLATMVGMTPDNKELQGTIGVTDTDTKVDAIVDYYALFDLTKRTEDQQNGPCQRAKPGAESSHGQLIGADPDSPDGEKVAAARATCPAASSDDTRSSVPFHSSISVDML